MSERMTKKKTGRRAKVKSPTNTTPKKTWQDVFLESLQKEPNITAAAKSAGINRSYAYEARESDAVFAAAWDEALAASVDKAEAALFGRAVDGVDEPVYQGGKMVGKVRRYSDTLLIFLLKSHRPQVYRERAENLNFDISQLTDEQLERLSKGESIYSVLAGARAGHAGATETPAGETGDTSQA